MRSQQTAARSSVVGSARSKPATARRQERSGSARQRRSPARRYQRGAPPPRSWLATSKLVLDGSTRLAAHPSTLGPPPPVPPQLTANRRPSWAASLARPLIGLRQWPTQRGLEPAPSPHVRSSRASPASRERRRSRAPSRPRGCPYDPRRSRRASRRPSGASLAPTTRSFARRRRAGRDVGVLSSTPGRDDVRNRPRDDDAQCRALQPESRQGTS